MMNLDQDELRLAMELIGEPVTESGLNDLIKMADVDKDGRINYEGIDLQILRVQYPFIAHWSKAYP